MAQTLRTAFAGGDSTAVIHRRSVEDRELTKIANRPSKRLRQLESSKAQKYEPYTGAELKRTPR